MTFSIRRFAGAVLAAGCAGAMAAPLDPVYSLVQKEKPAVIDTLRDLVNIGGSDLECEQYLMLKGTEAAYAAPRKCR